MAVAGCVSSILSIMYSFAGRPGLSGGGGVRPEHPRGTLIIKSGDFA